MSQNSNAPLTSQTVLGSGRAYPLPRIHNSIGQNVNGSSRSGRRSSGCRCRLGLGVNEKTGRLQWCPGFTCCKLLIVLPVVMLPLTLVLILLMRMDGMLLALRMQRQQLQQLQESGAQRPAYVDDYIGGEALADMLSEQLILPIATTTNTNSNGPGGSQDEAERIRRCMSFKFGLSEGVDVEERDLMKDSRTSFLPQDTTALPRDCLDALGYGSSRLSTSFDDYNNAEEYLRRRLRRASRNNYRFYRSLNLTERRLSPVALDTDDAAADENDAAILEGDQFEQLSGASKDSDDMNIASLQAFWNEEGTKESMRQAQANTMLKYMDPNVNPCNDFYKYACGNWEKLHPIPKDKAGFDTFEMLRENLDAVLKQLLESNDDDPPPSSASKKNKVVHISGNNYEQEEPTNADRVALAEVASPTKEERPEESRIVHIRRTAGDSNEETAKAEGDAKSDDEATRLRKHIVSRREALSQLLRRYRRDATSTIRKRLTAASPVAPPKASLKPPQAAKVQGAKVPNLAQRKARHLYQSCTNSRLLAKRGIQPLLSLIDNLGGWPVLSPDWNGQSFDWLNLTAQLRRYNNDILIVQWVGPDIKNSDENVIQFDQTSLGLPTREYFLQDVNAKYLQAYQRFMSEVMHKLGAPHDVALRTAAELIAFETQLAAITSPAEQRLNVTKLYKRMTLRQLHDVVPAIDWQRYLNILQQRQVQDSEEIVIYAVDYMHDLVALLAESRPSTVANYLLWRFVRHRINNVDDRFEDIKQNFYHALFGREESPSRWKVCIAQVNTNMGMALGSMFVTKYFDENSKRDTLRMTHELQQAFREILKTTDWLDPNTKHLAELKVNAMSLKIGYPDFILNPAELNEKYAGIEIHPEKYFENTLNVLLHTAKTEQSKLHELVNKTAWQTAPAIVNAYYSRNKNQIMFPAGILQPPFYHRHFPRSLNFGGIGVVIGHELTHGFDDKGRLFDRNGSIHKWWTDSSIRGFDERARCIIAQYSNYTVGEVGIALNGESTQGENIADNGGIRQAFHAYKRWLQENPNSAADERLPGINMTGEQLFFLNFGQVWCGAMRPEAVRNKLNTAIHSPGRFRVIGTLSNSKDFAREFQCPLGSPMNPEQKCSVW